MNPKDRKQYDLENFNGLFPLIAEVLHQVNPREEVDEYVVNGVAFQVRQKDDIIEMGLPIEAPIFPTLTFRKLPNHQVELLHYRIGKEFKDAIFQATDKYVVGKPKVSVIFKKALGAELSEETCFESTIPHMFNKNESSTITLEIKGFENYALGEYWDEKQPNTSKQFANKKANLVIYCGELEMFSKNQKQAIQLSSDGAFIMWKVDSIEYLMGIANSLRHSKEASLKIDLDEDDFFFGDEKSLFNVTINKISITLN
jgi:hypothetical protein